MWTVDSARSKRTEPPSIPSGVAIRGTRDPGDGLLLIYPLDPGQEREGQLEHYASEFGRDGPPVVAFATSFPDSATGETVDYVVNSIYAEQEYGRVDD